MPVDEFCSFGVYTMHSTLIGNYHHPWSGNPYCTPCSHNGWCWQDGVDSLFAFFLSMFLFHSQVSIYNNVGLWLVWAPPQINLVYSITRSFFAPLTNFRIVNLSKDFNWNQFTFNWFQFTFNWFSIEINLRSIDFNLLSIDFKSYPKVGVHNSVPSKQFYYWGSEPLMRYHLEQLFGCCFLIRV